MATDSFVQVAVDGAGKKIRNFLNTLAGVDVYQQVVTLAKSDGTLLDSGVPVSGSVSVSNLPATQPISAVSLPLPTGAALDATLSTIDTDIKAQAKLTDTQPVSLAASVAVTSAGLTNLDVALSTRTKPADQQHAIVDSGTLTAVTAITNALPAGTNVLGHVVTDTGSTVSVSNLAADQLVHATNLDVAVSTLLKAADTLTKVATVDTITNPVAVTGTFFQTTQPVSGTVALSGDALESLRTQRTMIGKATLRPRGDKLRRIGLHA